MAKNKLSKFADMETFDRVYQYPYARLASNGFPLRGKWSEDVFENSRPVILELGCGRGEYTIGLGRRFPETNFIGIDIKGARMWAGAKQANDEGLKNVAFLRTDIALINHFFAPGEVSEIWITFPDPQMKKVRKRLTGTTFLAYYRDLLQPAGTIHLKSDSPFLYVYTRALVQANQLPIAADLPDLHCTAGVPQTLTEIRTAYEQQWLDRGMTIYYFSWQLLPRETYIEPNIVIEPDPYRSFNRSRRSISPSADNGKTSDNTCRFSQL